MRIAKEPLRVRVGDVASKDTELRRAGSGDIVASNDTDGRLLSGVFWSRDRGGEPTDMSAGCAAVVTASTAWGVTMGTRSAGLEMEPRRRGDLILKTCACVRVFEIPSLSSSRGVLSREWLWPRASTAHSLLMVGSSFVNGALIAAGRWFITPRKSNFPADPAPSVESGPARV